MMRAVPAALAAFLFLAANATPSLAWWTPTDAGPARPRPVASIVLGDTVADDHSVPGVIKARTEVSLAFQTLGRLTRRLVDVGDVVRADDLLATLDPEDLQDQVRAARASAEAASVQHETALAAARRTRALAARNVATTAQLEQAEQALAAAIAADQQAQSELIRARDAESYSVLRAPFDGVITSVEATPGAIVASGDPILQLSAQDDLEAVIDLQPAMASRLQVGTPFQVWSESAQDAPRLATLSRIEPVANAVTRTRRVRLALDEDRGFRLGALIRARPASRSMSHLMIPAAAIVTHQGQPHVWLVTGQDQQRRVTLRAIQTDGLEVAGTVGVSAGVAPGDEIVVRGVNSLTEGQPVGESVAP